MDTKPATPASIDRNIKAKADRILSTLYINRKVEDKNKKALREDLIKCLYQLNDALKEKNPRCKVFIDIHGTGLITYQIGGDGIMTEPIKTNNKPEPNYQNRIKGPMTFRVFYRARH